MIEIFADWITYRVLSISPGSSLGGAVDFFIYDTIKIFLLLAAIIFIVSIIRSYLPPEKIRNILAAKGNYAGNVFASLFGIITPFCTCSAIPLFLGFIEAGVPLGATFSFLVASPMVNEVAMVMLFSMFGLKIAFIYIASGLAIAVFSGIVIGKLNVENLLEKVGGQLSQNRIDLPALFWKQRIEYAFNYTAEIVGQIWIYVVAGIGIGAWIHGYIPAEFLARYAGAGNWYAVPLAVFAGIPLYSGAAGIIPLVGALTEKGVATGTTLAFMMAVTGLSLPEFLILRRVMKTKLIAIFAAIVGAGIIFTGYLFNWILG